MVDSRKYTAFCGLYCLDCIPSNKHLFSILDEVENTLTTLQFEKYAEVGVSPYGWTERVRRAWRGGALFS